MIEIGHLAEKPFLTVRVSGTQTTADYGKAILRVQQAVSSSNEKLNAVIILDSLQEWRLAAVWKGLELDAAHYDDFQRIAVVGKGTIDELNALASSVITGANVEFFTFDQLDRAGKWAIAA
ncbi:STAS/SEC14 domain-containing protein [Leisingera sp. ANG59]|uniref:STAS/SEC14 domain-containing protein n=1 Tax=Leisingera sp. ANG59 TaxID=2675221 RepID=UPI001571893C|nr:STAS/SEC14 domain-containing protein [Leisingera sp. ANG59]NSY40664.1 hypothetical protein [Leisingera sp. ANG59]